MKEAHEVKTERLIDKKTLAEATGLTVSFIEKAMHSYSLPFYRLGRNVKFKISEVNKWIEQRQVS